jgi:hypothetical protein
MTAMEAPSPEDGEKGRGKPLLRLRGQFLSLDVAATRRLVSPGGAAGARSSVSSPPGPFAD